MRQLLWKDWSLTRDRGLKHMTVKTFLFAVCVFAVGSAFAQTGKSYSMNVGVENGKWILSQPGKCEIVSVKAAAAGTEDELTVRVLNAQNGKLAAPPVVASSHPAFAVKIGGDPPQQVPAGTAPPPPLKARITPGTAVAMLAADGNGICEGRIPAGAVAGPAGAEPTVLSASVVEAARGFLAGDKVSANEISRSPLERKITIHHLPNGSPAFALPAHVTEHDLVTLDIVLPEGSSAKADVTSCGARESARILGGTVQNAITQSGLQKGGGKEDEGTFSRVVFPQTLQCSEAIKYTLSVYDKGDKEKPATTADITLPIDPVYTFSVGVAAGYDMAAPVAYSLRDLPDASSAPGTSKFVTRSKAQQGLRTVVTATYHPFQFNPNEWSWTNLVAPFVGINPASPLNGAVVGNEFVMPSGLFGILAGMSVFQSDELPSQLALSADGKWTATGDLPRSSTYGHSFGAFLGINLNAIAVARLFAK